MSDKEKTKVKKTTSERLFEEKQKKISGALSKATHVDIVNFELTEELKNGAIRSKIEAVLSNGKRIHTPYGFTTNSRKNALEVKKKSHLSLQTGLFDITYTPNFYDKKIIFALDDDDAQMAQITLDILKKNKSLVFTLDSGMETFIVDNIDTKIPLHYDFNHETLSSSVLLPKKDMASESELDGIKKISSMLALYGITESRNIARAFFSNADLDSNHEEFKLLDTLRKADNIFEFAIKEAKALGISVKKKSEIKQVNKAAPYFIDYSSPEGELLSKKKGEINFNAVSFYSEDNITPILSEDIYENDILTHHNKEKSLAHLLSSLCTNSSPYSPYGKEGKTVSNTISRVAEGKRPGEMSTLNTKHRGIFFWKFKNEDELFDALMENNTPSLPAIIDNCYYMISRQSYTTTGNRSHTDTLNSIKKLKHYAKDNNGFAFQIYSERDKNILLSMSESFKYMITQTGEGKTFSLNELVKGFVAKESRLIPDIKAKKAIIGDTEVESLLVSFSKFDLVNPVFPNIISTNARNITFSQLIKNPYLIGRYNQIPGVSDILKTLATQKDVDIPAGKDFVCKLASDKEHHVLKDSEKYIEIDSKDSCGVFDLRHIPLIYDVEEEVDKKAFIEISLSATLKTVKKGESLTGLKESLENHMEQAKYALIKGELEREDKTFLTKEKITLLDASLQELLITDIPAYAFVEELKTKGIIKKSDRVKDVTLKKEDLNKIFSSIQKSIERDIEDGEDFYKKVDTVYRKMIVDEAAQRDKITNFNSPRFLRERSINLFKHIRANGVDKELKEFFNTKIKTPAKMAGEIFEKTHPSFQQTKEFLEKFYTGREFIFTDKTQITQRKEAIKQKIFKENKALFTDEDKKEKIDTLYTLMEEGGTMDTASVMAAATLINKYAFHLHIETLKKENDGVFSIEEMQSLLGSYLVNIRGLRPKQAKESIGIFALYYSLGVEKVAELIEMRWGKTRVGIVLTDTLAMIDSFDTSILKSNKKSSAMSLFFLQGKTLSDILLQAWEVDPDIVRFHTSILGNQKLFKLENSKYPLHLTDTIIPNIPVLVREANILQNPDKKSSLSPSDYVSQTFQKDILKITESLSDKIDMSVLAQNNKELIEDYEYFFENIPENNDAKKIAKSLYLYVLKLVKEKKLESPNTSPLVNQEIKRVIVKFWNEYGKELNKITKRKYETIFVGKEYIDKILDSTVQAKTITAKELKAKITVSHDVETSETFGLKNTEDNMKFLEENIYEKMFINSDGTRHEPSSQRVVSPSPFRDDEGKLFIKDFITKLSLPKEYLSTTPHFYMPYIQIAKIARSPKSLISKDVEYYKYQLSRRITKSFEEKTMSFLHESVGLTKEEIEEQQGSLMIQISTMSNAGLRKEINESIQTTNCTIPYISYRGEELKGSKINLTTVVNDTIKELGVIFPHKKVELTQLQANFGVELANILSNEVYKTVCHVMYAPKSFKRALKDRLSFLIDSTKSPTGAVELEIHLEEQPKLYILPFKIHGNASSDTEITELLSGLEWKGEELSKEDPSETKENNFYASKGLLSIEGNKTHFLVNELKSEKNEVFNFKKRKYQSNLTSTTIFDVKNSDITASCILTDETQQNISVSKLEKYKSLDNIGRGKKLQVSLSGSGMGTNKSTAASLAQISNIDAKQTEKVLRENNGIFKIHNNLLAFLLTKGRKVPILSDILTDAVRSATQQVYGMGSKTNIYNIAEETIKSIKAEVSVLEQIKLFEEENKIFLTHYDMCNEMETILKSSAVYHSREIKKDVNEQLKSEITEIKKSKHTSSKDKTEEINRIRKNKFNENLSTSVGGIEAFESSAFTMASLAPGSCNFLAMPAIADALENAYLSVKANNATYSVLDEYSKVEKDKHLANMDKPSPYKLALALESAALKKYRAAYSLSAVKKSYISIIELALKGLREHSENPDVLDMKTSEFNDLTNREKKSKTNGLLDFISDLIVKGGELPEKLDKIMPKVIESVNCILTKEEEISGLRKTLEEGEEGSLEFLDGFSTGVDVTLLKNLNFTHRLGGVERKMIPSGELTDKGYLVFNPDGGIMFGATKNTVDIPKDAQKLLYRRDIVCKPFETLPSIHLDFNVLFEDDHSILDILSVAKEQKNLMKQHIDKGENLRVMTARTVTSDIGLEIIVSALLERDNTTIPQTVYTNTDNKKNKEFIETLLSSKKLKNVLHDKNIQVIPFSPKDLKGDKHIEIQTKLQKNEGLHIVSNMDAVGAGTALDFIDTGFYISSIQSVESATQSFPRQIGDNKNISSYYLYLNHEGIAVEAKAHKEKRNLYTHIEKPIVFKEGMLGETEIRSILGNPKYPLDLSNYKVSSISEVEKTNKKIKTEFDSYRIRQTGTLATEDFTRLDESIYKEKVNKINTPRKPKILDKKVEMEKTASAGPTVAPTTK